MGIFLHLGISKSVQKKEWESVYEETLQLVKVFPLADKRKVNCRGINTICLVPTEEKEETYGWNHEKKRTVWSTVGDYETMHTAEEYYLSRDMIRDEEIETDAGDALLGVLPAYLNYDWKDSLCSHTYDIWGGKTQGEPYHIYLLAIACLIEFRLKNKAFVYGDITKGQCECAVELANKYLEEPIDIPDRCDMERLWKRVTNLPLSESEQIRVFERFYLGTKAAEFGEYVCNLCSKTVLDAYWHEEFKNVSIGTYGFRDMIKKYLLWGFDLKELCAFVDYNDENHNPQYEKFVKIIMDSKLHLKEKQYKDLMEKSAVMRCEWLIEQNRMLLIRDKDWDKIFKDIEENEDSYARYYPMVRIGLTSENLVYLTKAIVLNDELYDFCKEHT